MKKLVLILTFFAFISFSLNANNILNSYEVKNNYENGGGDINTMCWNRATNAEIYVCGSVGCSYAVFEASFEACLAQYE